MKSSIFIVFAVVCVSISAQNSSIIDALAQKDSITGAVVNIVQDEQITFFLSVKSDNFSEKDNLKKGFAVQVFSENSQSAKDAAFAIEKKIRTKFPDEIVRTERISPFWKVRVGKFATQQDAQPLRELLLNEFPELKGGIYIVKFSE
jgi:hypothetical protein